MYVFVRGAKRCVGKATTLVVVKEAKLLLWNGIRAGLAFNAAAGTNLGFLVRVKNETCIVMGVHQGRVVRAKCSC